MSELNSSPNEQPVVAALQMVSGNDIDHNLSRAQTLIEQAKRDGADLVVLPETFALFSARQQLSLGIDEAFGQSRVCKFLAEQASKNNLWIVGGTIPFAPTNDSSRVYAASPVFDNKGIEVSRYNKMHLFDVDIADKQGSYRESDTFLSGDHVAVVDTPVGRLGLAVCYDLRFPELFRVMFEQGVDIIAIPSAFTLHTGEAHWLALLKARAIENQCYVVGCNQGGQHSKSRFTSGGSAIIDGWGNVLTEAARGESVITAAIDNAALEKQRKAMPTQKHLRFTIEQN